MSDTRQVYELFIRTTPEALWQAITDGSISPKYFFGTSIQSSFRAGEPFVYTFANGAPAVDGEIIEANAPNRLVNTWRVRYDAEAAKETSRVTWLIEARGPVTKLTLTHELEGAPATAKGVGNDGWTLVLSGLKTLLETGEPLPFAPPGA